MKYIELRSDFNIENNSISAGTFQIVQRSKGNQFKAFKFTASFSDIEFTFANGDTLLSLNYLFSIPFRISIYWMFINERIDFLLIHLHLFHLRYVAESRHIFSQSKDCSWPSLIYQYVLLIFAFFFTSIYFINNLEAHELPFSTLNVYLR